MVVVVAVVVVAVVAVVVVVVVVNVLQIMGRSIAVLKTQRRRQRTFSSPCRAAYALSRYGFLSNVPEMANVRARMCALFCVEC